MDEYVLRMNEFLFLMHADAPAAERESQPTWVTYLAKLQSAGVLLGGSAIGDGICVSKRGAEGEIARHISGYLKVKAESMDAARALLEGNPVYESGGTVEIRELPRTE